MTNTRAAIKLENDRLMISGDLDFSSVVSLWNASLPLIANRSELMFDLSGVTSTKSAGLALLVEWIKLARRENKKIRFYRIPQQLMSIAGVCSVESLLTPLVTS